MYFLILPIFIFFLLLIILLWCYFKRFHLFIINYLYLIKFLFFNIILFIYYFIYLLIYSIFFILKNYRFFSYYFFRLGTTFLYFNKKSVYFLFWRYLVIYIISNISFFFYFLIKTFFKKIKKVFYFWDLNNIYLFLNIYLKIKYLNFKNIKIYLIKLYNFIIKCIYYIFYFINLPTLYFLLNTFKLNLFNRFKYKADPILNRNSILTLSSKLYYIYYEYLNINLSFIQLKFLNFKLNYVILLIFYIIITFFTRLLLYYNIDKQQSLIQIFLSNFYLLNNAYFKKSIFIKSFKMVFCSIIYSINLILINIIYLIFILFIYVVYAIFLFFKNLKYLFLYILLLFFCIKYYWIIYYFFLILYKHYLFNMPLFEIKESTRFFNFEYIDLRNYFNLIFLRNTLVDLSIFNNIIYNDVLNNLTKTISAYGFKVGSQYDINLYSLLNVRNKDTKFLNYFLNPYNKSESISLYKRDILLQKYMVSEVEFDMFRYVDTYKPKTVKTFRKVIQKNLAATGLSSNNLELKNKEYFFHVGHKPNYHLWKFFSKSYYKGRHTSTITLNSFKMRKLNQIPLKYIHIYNEDEYYGLNNSAFIRKYYKYPIVHYYLDRYKKRSTVNHHFFFYNSLYNFKTYKSNLNIKYKIPTFQWSSVRWRKKIANVSLIPHTTGLSMMSEEDQTAEIFFEVARKKLKKKRMFRIFYIKHQYPFTLLKRRYLFYILKNHSNINFKIIKKFLFLKNTRLSSMKRIYKRLLYTDSLLIRLFYNRLNPWDNIFFKNRLKYTSVIKNVKNNSINSFNYNFWFFFDCFKTDKFYHTKYNEFYQNDEFNLNFIFLKRLRKDHIKLKNNLLKLYSLYYYYYILESANYKHTFYSNLLPAFMRNDLLYWIYDNFKLSWINKIYLTKERTNIKLFKNISYLSKLFKSRFFAYFVYCDYTINSYNKLYYIKNKSYKLCVLNKINNLKRFFYFQNKHINGWSIFKYLNSFSFNYHIKKLLWHSPYSFLLFKDTLIINEKNNLNMLFNFITLYNFNDNIINAKNYLIIFNLFLNIIQINNSWSYMLNYKSITWNEIFLKTFNNYYNNGLLTPLHFIDIYRFVMNFLFEYYNNFLCKLIRYRYILNDKNYTFIEFIKYYYNNIFKHIYVHLRLQVYNYTLLGRYFFQKFWYKYLGFKYEDLYAYRTYRKAFIPFWFIYDYYIKLFVFYLLEKYYTKNFFVLYWFYWFNSYLFNNYYFILSYLNFLNFKYYLFTNFTCYYFMFFLNLNNINKIIVNCNNFINDVYYWYILLLFNYNINMFYNFYYLKMFLTFKWALLFINKFTLNIFEINFNKAILVKIYIEKLINYYINIIFNIKNILVYFKPNNYAYYKQRNFNKWSIDKTLKFNIPFKSTINYRDIYSFHHLTPSITFFNNIYLSNIYNYIYFMNMYNLNTSNIFNIFFSSFTYNYIYFICLMYLVFHWIIIILLYTYYKNFYSIFFFTYAIKEDPQYNWEQKFNANVVKMSNFYNSKKNKIYKKVWFNKKNKNFYKFYFFNIFLNKLSIYKDILYKIVFLNNKCNDYKIMELNFKNKKAWKEKLPDIVFFNYLKFFKNFAIMPFKLKKEGFLYNFNYLNFFNSNLFHFCFFYWVILIPYFFFEYVLIKYHLKGHLLIRYKMLLILQVLLDNFKWYINLYKYFGTGTNIVYNPKFIKTDQGYSHNYKLVSRNNTKNVSDQIVPAFHIFDRSVKMYTRLSPLGNYYYWFHKINKIEYFISYKNYFLNLTYKSVYFYYSYIYIFFLIIIFKWKYYKNFLVKNTTL